MMLFNGQVLSLLATPLYAIVIGAELIASNIRHTRSYGAKDSFHNACLSLLSGATDLLMRAAALAVLLFFYQYRLANLEKSWWYWVLLLLLVDFLHYLLHRLSHSSRFFWAVHLVHHSSTYFNFSVGFRAAALESFYRFLFFIPAALLGFAPPDILLVFSAGEIWAVLTHTEKLGKLGWLEYIFVTPSHHRVHHASNTLYLDRNLGSVFIFWDKLLGSFQEELDARQYEPIKYGLRKPEPPANLSQILFQEWQSLIHDVTMPGLRPWQRWQYLFGPPGWSHDGSRLTSRQLRKRAMNRKKYEALLVSGDSVRQAS